MFNGWDTYNIEEANKIKGRYYRIVIMESWDRKDDGIYNRYVGIEQWTLYGVIERKMESTASGSAKLKITTDGTQVTDIKKGDYSDINEYNSGDIIIIDSSDIGRSSDGNDLIIILSEANAISSIPLPKYNFLLVHKQIVMEI